MARLPILATFNKQPEGQYASLEAVNCYTIIGQESEGGKTPAQVISSPGLKTFAEVADAGVVRGMIEHFGILYAVIDNKFYQIDEFGALTERGTLNTSVGRVRMIDNKTQIRLDDEVNGYVYTVATVTLAVIADVDYVPSKSHTYLDGTGISVYPNGSFFQLSNINDFTSYSAIDVSSTSAAPSKIVAGLINHMELWLLTSTNVEIWDNTGGAAFPFERRSNVLIEYGCAATDSVVKVNNTIYWLARNKNSQLVIMAAEGYTPRIISNSALSTELATYRTLSDAYAFSYEERGRLFYQITFPSEDATWCIDLSSGLIHKKTSIHNNGKQGFHRANCFVNCYNKQLVGDFESGIIYEIDKDTFTDNGRIIHREVVLSNITNENKWVAISTLQLDMEVGVGTTTGQGVNPQIMMQYSKDGGKTFSAELWRSAGARGDYDKRVKWNRLGHARNWTFRFKMTDPVRWSLFAIDVEYNLSKG